MSLIDTEQWYSREKSRIAKKALQSRERVYNLLVPDPADSGWTAVELQQPLTLYKVSSVNAHILRLADRQPVHSRQATLRAAKRVHNRNVPTPAPFPAGCIICQGCPCVNVRWSDAIRAWALDACEGCVDERAGLLRVGSLTALVSCQQSVKGRRKAGCMSSLAVHVCLVDGCG